MLLYIIRYNNIVNGIVNVTLFIFVMCFNYMENIILLIDLFKTLILSLLRQYIEVLLII